MANKHTLRAENERQAQHIRELTAEVTRLKDALADELRYDPEVEMEPITASDVEWMEEQSAAEGLRFQLMVGLIPEMSPEQVKTAIPMTPNDLFRYVAECRKASEEMALKPLPPGRTMSPDEFEKVEVTDISVPTTIDINQS